MSDESPLIRSLRAAVAAAPEDVALRLHFAELLLAEGRHDEAVAQVAVALQHAPGDEAVRALMVRAMQLPAAGTRPPGFDWAAAEQEVAGVVGPRFAATEAP